MKSIILFGSGKIGVELLEYIETSCVSNLFHVEAFCDNNVSKCGMTIHGCKVLTPDVLLDLQYDLIVISTMFVEEIVIQLTNMGLYDDEKVIDYDYFKQLIKVKEAYKKRYCKDFEYNLMECDFRHEQIVVYTAITGNYDTLKDPVCVSPGLKYVCFTNNKKFASDIWNVIYIEDDSLTDSMLARKIKILPFEYMDVSGDLYWVDGKFNIIDDLRIYGKLYKKKESMLLFPHFYRDNICDETAELVRLKPQIRKEVIIQTGSYLMKGFSDNIGLYDTGCMYRNFEDIRLYNLMMEWWTELTKYSIRDQLSLPYILEKNNYSPDICDLVIGNNRFLKVEDHNKV